MNYINIMIYYKPTKSVMVIEMCNPYNYMVAMSKAYAELLKEGKKDVKADKE